MTTLKELRKENETLREENEDLKQQYNELRASVLGTYELLSDEPLETENSDDDAEEDEE
jgi:cell division protein FtsB